MSQDLFAAFGTVEDVNKNSGISHTPNSNSTPVQAIDGDNDDEDDDFGDFEDASIQPPAIQNTSAIAVKGPNPAPKAAHPIRPLPFSTKATDTNGPEIGKHPFAGKMDILFDASDEEYNAGSDELADLATNPEAAMAYSKRIIAAQESQKEPKASFPPTVSHTANTTTQQRHTKSSKDPNVLFDADDVSEEAEDDDDGWRDFEDSQPEHAVSTTTHGIDLLGLDDQQQHTSQSTTSQSQVPGSKSHLDTARTDPSKANDFHTLDDDAWDDFEESAPPAATTDFAYTDVPSASHQATSALAASHKPTTDDTPTLAPTNVPPPAILLSLFPSLITSAQSDLFDPLAKLNHAQKKQLLSHPATFQFLAGYISLGVVLGYIVAGRKSRWKRDQILAQGMKIGPAAASGRGGMKLAGVDKSEVTKEDREVLDVVRLWRLHVGKLRSAVTLANADTPRGQEKLPAVPEIALQFPVKTLKQSDGAMTAPHACALCGLKRDERVQQQGFEVEDVFHEWWITGLDMHVRCWNFWKAHKTKLKSR